MAGINKPPKAPKGYRPDKDAPLVNGKKWFETAGECRPEDRSRSELLMSSADHYPHDVEPTPARELAARLRHGADTGDPPDTLASRLYMRGPRHSITGHAWKLAETVGLDRFSALDLRPKGFVMTPRQLSRFEPEQMLNPIRMDFIRCGASEAKGGLFLSLHGQFNRATELVDMHGHGFVTDGDERGSRRSQEAPQVCRAAHASR